MATTGLFSCKQGSNQPQDTVDIETTKSTENIESQKPIANPNDKFIDTKYEYTDSTGKSLIIENSLPKGGLKYTDSNGKDYVYAIFWTRITNQTANPLELTIDFTADSFELPSKSDNYFKLYLPSDTMTLDKQTLFNYGLRNLESFLDNELLKSSSLQRTINPKGSSIFYVITLFNKGVEGTVRTGLSLIEQTLFYRINDKEIQCGQINLKKLILKK